MNNKNKCGVNYLFNHQNYSQIKSYTLDHLRLLPKGRRRRMSSFNSRFRGE